MSYSKGLFVQKEAERRALRDQMRDAFFAEIGLPRLKDTTKLVSDPATQQAKVLELCALAQTTHKGDMSGLGMLTAAMKEFDFSVPLSVLKCGIGTSPISMTEMLPEALKARHFDTSWSEWFDDE